MSTAVRSRKVSAPERSKRPELRVLNRRRGRGLIKRSGSRRIAPLTILATIAIGAVIAGILLEQVVLAQSAFKLTEIRQDLAVAEENREVLMLEAAKLDSAARIERYAREELGMIDPAPHDVRYIVADIRPRSRGGLDLATGGRLSVPGKAAADAAALGMADAP
jgi:cell division protein FtsB